MDRDTEAEMLTRCTAVARGDLDQVDQVRDAYEANIFRVAAMVIQSRLLPESQRLTALSKTYFEAHPAAKYDLEHFCRQPEFPSLPRLRDMLTAYIHHAPIGSACRAADEARQASLPTFAALAVFVPAGPFNVDLAQRVNDEQDDQSKQGFR